AGGALHRASATWRRWHRWRARRRQCRGARPDCLRRGEPGLLARRAARHRADQGRGLRDRRDPGRRRPDRKRRAPHQASHLHLAVRDRRARVLNPDDRRRTTDDRVTLRLALFIRRPSSVLRRLTWSPRRDLNAQPGASDAPALIRLSYVDVTEIRNQKRGLGVFSRFAAMTFALQITDL